MLGSQGDAGQFRTPRHIIDFIVAAVDPKKDETVCDPACGTAGFLISAYKHILAAHDGKDDADHNETPLTPDEKKKLVTNFVGYDISPDMVKLSKVNMYLHGFADPKIYEYDTLSSEEKWDETFDVMLANPPFMTPKGGIQPHKRFGVQANRAEVLFVDYIKEHLRPNGRAGVIVPEGIIFQSGTAYKALRKALIEDGLFAVVSLPAGVFNPYAGVKTSILFLDNALAKKTNDILFIKVTNDGFDLGAQRRPVSGNGLPEALEALLAYRQYFNERTKSDAPVSIAEVDTSPLCHLVTKEQIIASGDYNLSGDRYRSTMSEVDTKWPFVKLGDVARLMTGGTPATSKSEYYGGAIKWLVSGDIHKGEIFDCDGRITELALRESNARLLPVNSVLIALNGQGKTRGTVAILRTEATCNQSLVSINPDTEKLIPEFLLYILKNKYQEIRDINGEGQRGGLNMPIIRSIKIPLPPIEIQKEIIEQIEVKQQAIESAKAVIKSLERERERRYFGQSLRKLEGVEMMKLGDICKNLDSKRKPVTKSDRSNGKYPYYGASGIVDYVDGYIFDGDYLLVSEDGANLLARSTPIAFSVSGKTWVNNHAHILKFENHETQKFVEYYLNSIDLQQSITGSAQPKLNQDNLNKIQIPVPSLEKQRQMVESVRGEEETITVNRGMIEAMEIKINQVLTKI